MSPTAALEEIERLPAGMLEEIVETRSYAAMKRLYDAATTKAAREALPDTPLMAIVQTTTFELVAEERERQQRRSRKRKRRP